MIKQLAGGAALAMALGFGAAAQDGSMSDVLMDRKDGCMEGPTAQFGRYIGDWNIEDQGLQQDGVTWLPGNGARWNFTCLGNGIAVQDFWMPNGPEGGPAPGVGTNLRIYDPANERWDIAWTATRSLGFAHIRAEQNDEGNIIMHWVSPTLPQPRRITFFTPTEEGWNWVMEMSFDEGKSWTEVYKIKATPR